VYISDAFMLQGESFASGELPAPKEKETKDERETREFQEFQELQREYAEYMRKHQRFVYNKRERELQNSTAPDDNEGSLSVKEGSHGHPERLKAVEGQVVGKGRGPLSQFIKTKSRPLDDDDDDDDNGIFHAFSKKLRGSVFSSGTGSSGLDAFKLAGLAVLAYFGVKLLKSYFAPKKLRSQ
jgi:hypothetical protein